MLKKLSIPVLLSSILFFLFGTAGLFSCSKEPIAAPIIKTDSIIPTVADSGLFMYAAPAGTVQNKDYTVQVRNEGGTWHEIFEYNAVNRNKGPFVGSQVPLSNMTFAYFDSDFRNRIEVKVTMNNRASINNVRIRPTSYGITYTKSGYSISFFLDKPRNVSVEFEGDTYHNLFIYANAKEVNPPKEGDAGVIYYGPGVHNVGSINLGSGKTIYLAGGAIVKGSITGTNITNASIRGHGILQGGNIHLNNSSNITIDGIIIIDSPGWTIVPSQVNSSLIQNVKIINQVVSSDGTDVSGCSDLTFDNVFYRIPDDCISLKCNKVTKPNKNILIKNSVFWADAAHGILIGPEGNGTSTSDVLITNCDFLEAKSSGSEYWGVIGITNGDNMTIRDITIENSRVEDFQYSNLVSFRIETNQWTTAPGGPIKNIVFRNITFNGNNANYNYIKGYDDTRNVDSVTFDNLQINGQRIMSAQQGNFTIGPFATNVMFK